MSGCPGCWGGDGGVLSDYFKVSLWQSLFSVPCPGWYEWVSVLQAEAKGYPRDNKFLNWDKKPGSLMGITVKQKTH